MKKKACSFVLVVCTLLVLSCGAYAGSHDGTYSMTGGIFYKQTFSKNTSLTIDVYPTKGTNDCNMGIYTAKKKWLGGWTGCDYISTVSSVEHSHTTYTTKKKIDGIYFRDWSGFLWEGTFRVEW